MLDPKYNPNLTDRANNGPLRDAEGNTVDQLLSFLENPNGEDDKVAPINYNDSLSLDSPTIMP